MHLVFAGAFLVCGNAIGDSQHLKRRHYFVCQCWKSPIAKGQAYWLKGGSPHRGRTGSGWFVSVGEPCSLPPLNGRI